jgi:hypothetical protein
MRYQVPSLFASSASNNDTCYACFIQVVFEPETCIHQSHCNILFCFIQPLPPPALSALHASLACFLQHADCSKVNPKPLPITSCHHLHVTTSALTRRLQAAAAVIEQFVRGHLSDCLLVQIPLVCAHVTRYYNRIPVLTRPSSAALPPAPTSRHSPTPHVISCRHPPSLILLSIDDCHTHTSDRPGALVRASCSEG